MVDVLRSLPISSPTFGEIGYALKDMKPGGDFIRNGMDEVPKGETHFILIAGTKPATMVDVSGVPGISKLADLLTWIAQKKEFQIQ